MSLPLYHSAYVYGQGSRHKMLCDLLNRFGLSFALSLPHSISSAQSKCSFLTWQFLSSNCAFNFHVGTVSICDNSVWKLFCGMVMPMMLQTLLPRFKYRCFISTNGSKKIDLRWIKGTQKWGRILKKIMKNQYFDSHNELGRFEFQMKGKAKN